MTPNRPGETPDFPSSLLLSGATAQEKSRSRERSSSNPFEGPLREMGYELGKTAHFEHALRDG